MHISNTNLFTALDLGHITFPQLATFRLFSIISVDVGMLLNAGYINTFGQTNRLTVFGFQASNSGHIIPSQLQLLSLYPLQERIIRSDIFTEAGYLTIDCIPTALGLSALYTLYLLTSNFAAFGCQMDN